LVQHYSMGKRPSIGGAVQQAQLVRALEAKVNPT